MANPPTSLPDMVLVCRRCSEKLEGAGFGPEGKTALPDVLRNDLGLAAAGVEVREGRCMRRCPWRGVTLLRGGRPRRVFLIEAGTSSPALAALLGLPAPDEGPA